MSNFCIMRTKKLKTDANVGASLSHCLRTRETPNADEARTKNNWYSWKGEPSKVQKIAMKEYRKRLPEKVRKNGVRAVELMMTASPEFFKGQKRSDYLNACIQWAHEKFGKENCFLSAMHFDEKTPHVSIYFVPIDPKGKLNCRHYLGGREKLQNLQDDFANTVGRQFKLDRGLKGSRAKHQSIKSYYAKIESMEKALEAPKKDVFESTEKYIERYKDQIKPLLKYSFDNKKALEELPKVQYAFEKYRKENIKLDDKIKSLNTEIYNEKIKTSKAEKRVDDISRRIDKTLEHFGENSAKAFNDKYYEIKKAEENTRSKTQGYSRS